MPHYPPFFDRIPTITLRDPLSEFLGAAEGGLLEYAYLDAVKLAGHSCPTVAGTWLMAVKSLAHLYGSEIPERGAVRVALPGASDEGVTGVMANVLTLITGAAAEGGFKGIAGRFARCDLLRFDAPVEGDIAFERVDTGQQVTAYYDASIVPMAAEAQEIAPQVLGGHADAATTRTFGRLWQERVERILTTFADDPRLIRLQSA